MSTLSSLIQSDHIDYEFNLHLQKNYVLIPENI